VNAEQAGPVQVVIAWPATIYVTVEVGPDGPRIVGSEVIAKDSGVDRILGHVHDVRGAAGTAAVADGPEAAEIALEYVAIAQWPNPTMTA
jgi:hypothetical protein